MATKQSNSGTNISFDAFSVALKVLTSACGALQSFYLSPGKKGTTEVSASLNGSEAIFKVVGVVTGLENAIEVASDVFLQAIKGRKEGQISMEGTSLVLKSGSYKATVHISEATSTPTITPPAEGDEFQEFTLSPEIHEYLVKKLPLVRIEKSFSAMPDVMLNMRFGKTSRYLACYEPNQLCFLNEKHKGEEGVSINLALPYTRFSSFIKDLPIANCKMYITPDILMAVAPQFRLKIALPTVDEGSAIDPNATYEKSKEVTKTTGKPVAISSEALTTFLENSRALVAIGTMVEFSGSKTGTLLKVNSLKGKTQQSIKSNFTARAPFSLDFRFVQTLIQKAAPTTKKGEDTTEQEVTFELVDNTFVVCRSNVTYLALLSADTSESEPEKED